MEEPCLAQLALNFLLYMCILMEKDKKKISKYRLPSALIYNEVLKAI